MRWLPWWLSGKESACRCGFDFWVGKIPGEGNDIPLPIYLPGKTMDRGAWWATIHGVAKSDLASKQYQRPMRSTQLTYSSTLLH